MKKKHHLVVDGSNIATEGRQLPSLAQLEEALEAFLAEHRFERVTVVVDATFGHRINAKERRWYEDAVTAGRIITPPAGAIGRGDAFILEIAKRAGATILSNDSFQEFHGDNAWLFEEGRLFGGKPVPHVGWVFVPRSPVRGPTSRRAVKKAKAVERVDVTETAVAKRAEETRPATAPAGVAEEAKPERGATEGRRRGRRAATKREEVAATPAVEEHAPVERALEEEAQTTAQRAETLAVEAAAAAAIERAPSATPTLPITAQREEQAAAKRPGAPGARLFNEPEKYERFRDAHPIGSLIELVIDRFSSHGAYARADDVEVYIPTKSLGDPPPQRARDVLHIGELVGLIVDRYDDATCAIDARAIRMDDDIAYYAASRASTEMHEPQLEESMIASSEVTASRDGSEQPTRRSEPVATKKKAAAKRAPAKKAAAKKKAPAKKAPAKKKAAAKRAPARKTAAKKAPARKTAAKKTAAKKTAAKKAPAKRKATAKKTAAKKAPAKRKATAKKSAAKKAPAKRTAKRTAKRR